MGTVHLDELALCRVEKEGNRDAGSLFQQSVSHRLFVQYRSSGRQRCTDSGMQLKFGVMMKSKLFLLALAGALVISCATVQQNIDARTYLAKCKYEYAGLNVTGVVFSSGILIDSVDFDVRVKITNTTDRDVALDHADLSFFLDRNHVLDVAHKRSSTLFPKAFSTETVAVDLPFGGIIKTLGHRPRLSASRQSSG